MDNSKSHEIMGAISECFFDSFSSRLLVRGWFLGPEVDKIEILLNDEDNIGQAILNLERADVLEKYPEYDNPRSGWMFKQNIAHALNEKMEICVYVHSSGVIVNILKRKIEMFSSASGGATNPSTGEQGSVHEKELSRQVSNPVNKMLFNTSELSSDDLSLCLDNDDLFAIGMYSKNGSFMNAVAESYQIPVDVLAKLFSKEQENWSFLVKNKLLRHVQSLRETTKMRLRIYQSNNRALKNILEILDVQRESFLDVGCQFGYLLVGAAAEGFKKVAGVEIVADYREFATELQKIVSSKYGSKFSYYVGNFGDPDFALEKFTFITCIDVLEHTPNLEKTVNNLIKACASKGMIFISQGNGSSLMTASNEPHYNLPCLSILPRELAVEVLRYLGKVDEKKPYIVSTWPTLEAIVECCKDKAQIEILKKNVRTDEKYPDISELTKYLEIFKKQLNDKLMPLLSQSLKKEVKQSADEYLRKLKTDMRDLNPFDFQKKYLISIWNIVIKPDSE